MRRFLKVGIIEIVILLVIILGVCGILVFYKVPPFVGIYNAIPFLPDRSLITRGYYDPNFELEYSPVVPQVAVRSEIEGITLELVEEQQLKDLLGEWKVFGREYTDNKGNTSNGKPLEKVTFVLTAEEQPVSKLLDQDGNLYSSTNFLISGSEATVPVYMSESILNSTDPLVDIAGLFEYQALFTLYTLNNIVDATNLQQRTGEISQILKDLRDKNVHFFVIQQEE